jgi:hypothetical protein
MNQQLASLGVEVGGAACDQREAAGRIQRARPRTAAAGNPTCSKNLE